MRYLLLFLLVVAIFVVGRQSFISFDGGVTGQGPVRTESRTTGDFHAITFESSGNLNIIIAPNTTVEVSAQENILPFLKTENDGGVLKIYLAGNVRLTGPIDIKITCPALDAIDLTGSGQVRMEGPFQAEKLRIDLNGSGDLVLPEAKVKEAKMDITGSGRVKAGGQISDLQVSINGSGEMTASGLHTDHCFVDISGSGSADCGEVSQTLRAEINGSGDVYYQGNPAVTNNISGSGKVVRR